MDTKITLPFKPTTPSALVIDLEALRHNYKALKGLTSPHTECAGIVKADGYGIGMERAAMTLYDEGCTHFFVAMGKEGQRLRTVIPTDAEIYVLSGLREEEERLYIECALTPVLNDLEQVKYWNRRAQELNCPLPAILHLDTGITRTGLKFEELYQLGISHISNLEIKYVMSHLACAYDPTHGMNRQQLEFFDQWHRKFPIAPASLANSGGVFLGSAYHMDMIRPGLALYGSAPGYKQAATLLKPVVSFYGQVLQVGSMPKGYGVGYDSTFITSRPSRIATIGVGYGDGYLRSLSNKGVVYVAGHRVPIVGRISMDLLTIDVTDIPEDACKAGDWVEFMGHNIPLDEVAERAGTAPWEILTSLSKRAHRHYIPASDRS